MESASLNVPYLRSCSNLPTSCSIPRSHARSTSVFSICSAFAIRSHSSYRIPEGLAPRTEKLCHILRDADKIDILRVNVDVPLEEIYNTTTEELRNAAVTPAVMDSFYEHHATLRSIKRTPVDHVVGHISLVFELVFPESVRIVKEQGYLEKLLHFESRNAVTNAQFAELRAEMERYLKGR